MDYSKHIDLLGYKAQDKVTSKKGVITHVGFDLYGCIQCILTDDKGEGIWLDVTRIKITSKSRVLDFPRLHFPMPLKRWSPN